MDSAPSAALHLIWLRFRDRWWLKNLGYTTYLTAFMTLYFVLLRHPLFPVRTLPLTDLDHAIGFAPWSLILYASLWFYISLVPSLFHAWSEMRIYLIQVTLLSLIGFTIFLFWPTAVPVADIDWSAHPSVAFLKAVDATGNACPSMHVAFAVLTAVWLYRLLDHVGAPLWAQLLNLAWCVGIVYSTLATKQHVAWDVYAGAPLGLFLACLPPRPVLSVERS
ncbi:MAG TPA: phosphatase PAP2 family protein [Gammaproteobacteria bacterium]